MVDEALIVATLEQVTLALGRAEARIEEVEARIDRAQEPERWILGQIMVAATDNTTTRDYNANGVRRVVSELSVPECEYMIDYIRNRGKALNEWEEDTKLTTPDDQSFGAEYAKRQRKLWFGVVTPALEARISGRQEGRQGSAPTEQTTYRWDS